MANVEEAVRIAAKMYRCRKSAKFLFGDQYSEKVKFYIDTIQKVCKANGVNEIKAILQLCKDKKVAENEVAVMMLMSAALEISEGNTTT